MEPLIALSGLAAYCGFSYSTRGCSEIPEIRQLNKPVKLSDTDSLRLMTLNIAHGRGASLQHQLFMRRRLLEKNLDQIATVIRREKPHFCALQESDARTFYSNKLHQSQYLAEKSGMAAFTQGRHVNGMNFVYGTAIVTNCPIFDPLSIAFKFRPPNPTKGFVIVTVLFKNTEIDIVSVHLDFMRKRQRLAQIDTLIKTLKSRGRPAIVMGDFNSEWHSHGSLSRICRALELKAWHPEQKQVTFTKLKKRLDWILIPADYDFKSYQVLNDPLSDHLAVAAEVS